MRFQIFLAVAALAAWGSVRAGADEKLAVLQASGQTYTNVNVTEVTATDVFFTYPGGMANVKIKQLSPELQKHFGYNVQRAAEVEAKQAENKAKYQAQVQHEPATPAPGAAATAADWGLDLPTALNQARSANKLVLLDFTGSDWCPWCIKFDQEVLSTPEFAAYAGRKLELVKVDFPRHMLLPDVLRRDNEALAKQFNVDGYPTYVLLNAAGQELGRQTGYTAGGPDAFIAELDRFGGR
jgi:thiol-disulfide isomerase/thioredoxin